MSFLRLTLRQIKWTKFKKWKRNHSKKFNLELNLFLWFRINYSQNWECFDQSCVKINWTETVHGTLRFLYLSYLLHMEYVWKSSLWIGIFQRVTQWARILLTSNIQWIYRTEAAVVSTITSYKSAIHFDFIAEWNQMNLSRHPLEIILSRHLSEKDCCLRSLRTYFPQGKSKLLKF